MRESTRSAAIASIGAAAAILMAGNTGMGVAQSSPRAEAVPSVSACADSEGPDCSCPTWDCGKNHNEVIIRDLF